MITAALIVFYLIGYVLAYRMQKKDILFYSKVWVWSDVIHGLFFSLLSWVWVVLLLFWSDISYLPKSKPPKWL